MSFKLRYILPVRSDVKTISGVVATEQILNPGFGNGGPTGPTGSGKIPTDPVFNNIVVTNNLSGDTASFSNSVTSDFLVSNTLRTSSINFISGAYSTTFQSSTGMTGSIILTLPQSIPNMSKSYLSTDSTGNLLFDPYLFPVTNLKTVSNNPTADEFLTIESAISSCVSSIPGPSVTNPFMVYIKTGVYNENLLTIPGYVYVAGQQLESVIIRPNGGHDMIHMEEGSTLYNCIIENVTGVGISVTDAGIPSVLIHKVSIRNCFQGFYCNSPTKDSEIYMEYCDFTDCINDMVMDNSTFINFLSLENHFIIHQISNSLSPSVNVGQNCQLRYESGQISGIDNIGVGISATSNAIVDCQVVVINNYGTAIESIGSSICTLQFNGPSLTDNIIDINVSTGTSGYFFGVTDVGKTIIPTSSPFYIYNKNNNVYTVSKKGGNFTSLNSALNYITDSSSTNNYIINITPGTYIEPPITIPHGIVISGVDEQSCILVPSDNTSNFLTCSNTDSIKHLTIAVQQEQIHQRLYITGQLYLLLLHYKIAHLGGQIEYYTKIILWDHQS
ncbi:MAG: hypothetical protein PHG66_00450 [Candidatus Colwellbacteria bacterium]|nr:hypothetical protein [Candidatus Colwellbacteria bacterium]